MLINKLGFIMALNAYLDESHTGSAEEHIEAILRAYEGAMLPRQVSDRYKIGTDYTHQPVDSSGKYQAYKELWISWRANLGDMELRQAHRWVLGVMERFMDEHREGHIEASYDEIDNFFGLPKAPYDYLEATKRESVGWEKLDRTKPEVTPCVYASYDPLLNNWGWTWSRPMVSANRIDFVLQLPHPSSALPHTEGGES